MRASHSDPTKRLPSGRPARGVEAVLGCVSHPSPAVGGALFLPTPDGSEGERLVRHQLSLSKDLFKFFAHFSDISTLLECLLTFIHFGEFCAKVLEFGVLEPPGFRDHHAGGRLCNRSRDSESEHHPPQDPHDSLYASLRRLWPGLQVRGAQAPAELSRVGFVPTLGPLWAGPFPKHTCSCCL